MPVDYPQLLSFLLRTTILTNHRRFAIMTTFIPSLTLPAALFASPAAAILFPVALGTAVGFSVRRTLPPSPLQTAHLTFY